MRPYLLVPLAICLALSYAQTTKAADLPPELLFRDKPVIADCVNFIDADSPASPRDLNTCGKEKLPAHVKRTVYDYYITRGFFGYGEEGGLGLGPVYNYYKYLGQIDGLPVIWIEYSSGNTGRLSSIEQLERTSDTVRLVKAFHGGDRCNGGVENAKIENGKLKISYNVTASDFPELAGIDPTSARAFGELDLCAVCCLGTATFEDDIFQGISLTDKPDEANASNPTQACFNKVLLEHMQTNGLSLSPDDVKRVTEKFADNCNKTP